MFDLCPILLSEPLVVGKFCEARDPYLAYIAYAKGLCDDELIAITNDNSMFKQQARYLIKRRQLELWAQVLAPDNIHRRALIDQVSWTYTTVIATQLTCHLDCCHCFARVHRS